jgi:hypothetical protein
LNGKLSMKSLKSIRDALYTNSAKDDIVKTELMPYSSVAHLIENFPLILKMKVPHVEVHKCLAFILNKVKLDNEEQMRDIQIKKEEDKQNIPDAPCTNSIPCCDDMNVVKDMRNGCMVCNNCGVVSKSIVYGESFFCSVKQEKQTHIIKNDIPNWVFMQNAIGGSWYNIQLSTEIEHWNTYVNLPHDCLGKVKYFAIKMEKRASDLARIAAGFLMVYISNKFDITNLDFTVTTLKYEQKSPISKCKICNENMYYICDVKRHKCFGAVKRKQWSFVKNQSCKIKRL